MRFRTLTFSLIIVLLAVGPALAAPAPHLSPLAFTAPTSAPAPSDARGLLALAAVAGALGMATAAGPNINATTQRTDIAGDVWPEGDLPEQMGDGFVPLLPGADEFRLPVNLPQLWVQEKDQTTGQMRDPLYKDGRTGQDVPRATLKFDRQNPLVIVGGKYDGMTMTATLTTNPRPRGKKSDPKTVWVSDLAYLLEISLGDKSRPRTVEALKASINKCAGRTIRLKHGLSAHCRADKVRYVAELDPTTQQPTGKSVEDPTATHGCDERYYTKDFKLDDVKPGEEPYSDQIQCDCGAMLRGFPSIDQFLPPAPVVAPGQVAK